MLSFVPTARGDGLIIVENPPTRVPGHFPFAPLEVTYHHVNVEINDGVATTSVDQEFRNPTGARMEGTYLFPLPDNAHIDKFSMDINGTQVEAELLPSESARSIYEETVRKMRDPALLEYVGRGAFKARIFPIEPNSTKRIQIKYTQLLKDDAGLTEYGYSLNTEKFSSKLIPNVSMKVKIRSSDPLKSVYCPTHDVEIKRSGANEAVVGFEQKNTRPDTDFKLLFARQAKDVGVKLLTYKRSSADDGYFMLMASPGWSEMRSLGGGDANAGGAKDIVFVLDTSGSMAERGKLDQAKKALNYCLANLGESDRFDIVRFSTESELLFDEMAQADADHVTRARAFVDSLKPRGGTAIDDALKAAMKLRSGSSGRPFMLVFLTDGAPTVGVTNEDELVRRATDRASDVRIFSFGIGNDVNTHLLDRISDATRAASQYVAPNEDIELKVSSFYDKVSQPIMTDLHVSFSGGAVAASELYPSTLPDLFKGQTLLLFGRYHGSGPGSVKIEGNLGGRHTEFAEDVNFAANDTSQPFIPTMWATRRVGWLLDEIRQHGESPELKDEVVRLAREHGIVTPYTAYLIMEDEARKNVPVANRSFQDLEKDSRAATDAKRQFDSTKEEAAQVVARSGAQAVDNARAMGSLKTAENLPQSQAAGPGLARADASDAQGYRAAQNYAQQVRNINGRAFYQNANRWTDSTAQQQQNVKQKRVRFNSDDYFALLRDHPSAAQWLALGNNIDVVIDDTIYSISDEG
jgi:Ca-activated chloride channel family protein